MTGATLTVGVLQSAYGEDLEANIARTVDLVRAAADLGAEVVVPSELFQGPYFCVTQDERWFASAHPWREHPCVLALAPLAAELEIAIPVSKRHRGPAGNVHRAGNRSRPGKRGTRSHRQRR